MSYSEWRPEPHPDGVEFFGGPFDGDRRRLPDCTGAVILSRTSTHRIVHQDQMRDPTRFRPELLVRDYKGHYVFQRGFSEDRFVWRVRGQRR